MSYYTDLAIAVSATGERSPFNAEHFLSAQEFRDQAFLIDRLKGSG